MGFFFKKEKRGQRLFFDYRLLLGVIILMCFGLIMLYSASAYEAATSAEIADDMYYFRRQAIVTVVATFLALGVSRCDYHGLERWAPAIYWIALLLMAMVRYTPFGVTAGGSRRWLRLGIQFQPAEIAKIAVILLIPSLLIKMGDKLNTRKGFWFATIAGAIQAFGAFYLTDNLSTAIIIMAVCMGMIFLAHRNTRWFVITIAALIGAAVAVRIYLGTHVFNSEDFRLRRIFVWASPESHLSSGGYQVMQGLYAIGSGGLFGKGLGNSTQKLSTIPEAQNDMIFSIVCEELGLFGAIILLILFGYILYRLFVIAENAEDRYGSLVVSGIFCHIALQVILNICVVLNIIPTTGVTLPFVSYGGSSVFFLMFEIGVALSVSSYITVEEDEQKETKNRIRTTARAGRRSRRRQRAAGAEAR